ncbi:hypothetical protein NHQ30_004850 [Ciborinia camelliae]|nr:hypothetical protein NHQ30_004850 [Ciborinia camelliae]
MTLANNLLAVLEANASISPISPVAGDTDAISSYKPSITKNAVLLDEIYAQSTAVGISTESLASLSCKAALLLFGNNVITQQSTNYTTEEERNWFAQNSLEVALALRIITTLNTKFAVRGGGHNPNPGFGSIGRQGILFDLRNMKDFTLNEDKSIVSLGPGNTWDVVYGELEKFDLSVAGGRAAGVGVVLADSTIIQVNENKNADLFKALKGGGPNFGMCTSDESCQEQLYNASDAAAIMKATIEVQKAMLQDDRIGFFLSETPGGLTAGMVYKGQTSHPVAFKAFDNINPLVVAIPPTSGTFQSCALALSLTGGQIYKIASLSVAMDATLYVELHDIFAAFNANYNKNNAISLTYTHQPFSAQGAAWGEAKGGNSLNISSQDQSSLTLTNRLVAEISNAAAIRGLLLELKFMNDANYLQSPITSYGAASLEHLRSVGVKYDHQGVFQKLQNDGTVGLLSGNGLQLESDSAAKLVLQLIWYELIRNFSYCKWTCELDVFPGFSGIAALFYKVSNDQYLAGIWRKDLYCGLIWVAEYGSGFNSLQKLVGYIAGKAIKIAPSWSWAGTQNFGEFCITDRLNFTCRTGDFMIVHSDWAKDSAYGSLEGENLAKLRFLLVSSCCSSRKDTVESPIGDASQGLTESYKGLEGSANITEAQFSSEDEESSLGGYVEEERDSKSRITFTDEELESMYNDALMSEYCDSFFQDSDSDFDSSKDCNICADKSRKRDVWGLLIYPAEKPNTYYRVGMFISRTQHGGSKIFENASKEELVLI